MSLLAGIGSAEEIAPFKLTGIDAYATLSYLSDEQAFEQPDAGRSRTAQAGWQIGRASCRERVYVLV